jgi:hypothetical protein
MLVGDEILYNYYETPVFVLGSCLNTITLDFDLNPVYLVSEQNSRALSTGQPSPRSFSLQILPF